MDIAVKATDEKPLVMLNLFPRTTSSFRSATGDRSSIPLVPNISNGKTCVHIAFDPEPDGDGEKVTDIIITGFVHSAASRVACSSTT